MNENSQESTQFHKQVSCPICRANVREDRLGKHKSKIHKIPKKNMVRCLHCKSYVRVDKIESHVKRVHDFDYFHDTRPALVKICFSIPLEDTLVLEHQAFENNMGIEGWIRELIRQSSNLKVDGLQVEIVPP